MEQTLCTQSQTLRHQVFTQLEETVGMLDFLIQLHQVIMYSKMSSGTRTPFTSGDSEMITYTASQEYGDGKTFRQKSRKLLCFFAKTNYAHSLNTETDI